MAENENKTATTTAVNEGSTNNPTENENPEKNVENNENEEFSNTNGNENDGKTENSNKDEKSKDNKTKQQSKKDNEYFANRRRELEQRQKELKEIEEKAYKRAILEAVKTNPFTQKEMKTDRDVQVYLNMKKLETAGHDPVSEYYLIDDVIAQEKAQETKPKIDPKEDASQFVKDFPDVSLAELNKNERFLKFAKGKIGNIPLSEIYRDYEDFIGEFESEADKKARSLMAKAKATPGVTTTTEKSDNEYYTIEEIKKMPQAEISKNWDKVLKSLAKVRSQK